jgi:hypothetical protein
LTRVPNGATVVVRVPHPREGNANMKKLAARSLDAPDEVRTFDKGHLDVVAIDGLTFGRAVFEPGWKWSECVKAIAGTDSCELAHTGYVLSGRMHIQMDDGQEAEFGPGDVMVCPPGHDAWILGDEPCVMFDFSTAPKTYAKR